MMATTSGTTVSQTWVATTYTMDSPMMVTGWATTQSFTDTRRSTLARRGMFQIITITLLLWFTTMVFVVSGVDGPTGQCAARLNVELLATNTELASAAVPTLHWATLTAAAMMKKLKLASMILAP